MSLFNNRLKELRNERSLTQEQLANILDIPSATIRRLEVSNSIPRRDRLVLLANFFNVSTDYLLGETDDKTPSKKKDSEEEGFSKNNGKAYYNLTAKDEKDIGKDLERMLADLQSNEALAFNGEPMDEETKRLFAISLENSLRLARELSKQKFTPNKYRD
ncbi:MULTISPECIES: helix-turn-helix transcriptional regulator [unclassified Paenibacillus]|uniref:helix-turn-helix domain-containing protein n=1 Tax=unclassified Paenibacillus TaxID=185978 RepID=UPI0024071E36|nr:MULTISPECIES: helix-turn-helix transcriptional regulator [unclassified Paenibacillus]MDF9841870.1 transcriptional regulator with XRE-family HTH domain [Paenibacillus sp. PastF-2]MDF9848449.1 transcriptional regulator with XRE-family HTH domain [Paenibacillus sp. PastM-2]MDF9855030.1 transcriptional regulator with XRE-family HTH domain [Paenibacillus sp. PastF-1]MDH6480299.1 transcriptional regulator with XRE-family HTH domain [Paenibacillus sp. PastH-2]MDH6507717.1 transcriptional regulator